MASNFDDIDLFDEPSIDELLAEPIIQLIMQRDGIDASSMRGEFDRVRLAYVDAAA